MTESASLSAARLIGDPARAALLLQLLSGRAHTAGELASGAALSPQVASNGLGKLLAGGLLAREVQGRHHYYRLARPEVAQALEALLLLDEPLGRASRVTSPRVPDELRFARRCYDHLAGELGVQLTQALVQRGCLEAGEREFSLTSAGEVWFKNLGIEPAPLRRMRRSFARTCLDWSERAPHLAGALGAALLGQLLALGWLAPTGSGRGLRLTVAGALALERELGLRTHREALAS